MGDVIELFPNIDGEDEKSKVPTLSGEAQCGACGHEWSAVADVGVVHFDCPHCGRMWGTFKSAVEPDTTWRCECGEKLFWLTPRGAICRACGFAATDWV